MSTKKLDKLSTEDLLKALDSPSEVAIEPETIPDDIPPVLEFIQRFNLKSGKNRVESRLLWNLYLQYYPATITRHQFTEHANKLLKYSNGAYLLSSSSEYLYSLLVNTKSSTTKKTKVIKPKVSLVSFIEKTNATSGEHKIPWFAFFHLYRCYAIDRKVKKPASKTAFISYAKTKFKTSQNNDGTLFLVDEFTANKIPKSEYDHLKKIYDKEKYTKR